MFKNILSTKTRKRTIKQKWNKKVKVTPTQEKNLYCFKEEEEDEKKLKRGSFRVFIWYKLEIKQRMYANTNAKVSPLNQCGAESVLFHNIERYIVGRPSEGNLALFVFSPVKDCFWEVDVGSVFDCCFYPVYYNQTLITRKVFLG